MENIKITLPQIPSLKIVLPGQGGTPITVDSEMSDTSENPVQNKVIKKYIDNNSNNNSGGVSQEYVDNAVLSKVEPWRTNTEYKEGDYVIGDIDEINGYIETGLLQCKKSHTSFGTYARKTDWVVVLPIRSRLSLQAAQDGFGQNIYDTYATKEELENFTSNEKVYDCSSETTNDLILEHNSLYYFGALTTLSLAISSNVNIESVDAPFECSIMFTSGETATNLDYSASPIVWSGDDCDSDGHFVPEVNKTYEISIKKFGLTISARVGVI